MNEYVYGCKTANATFVSLIIIVLYTIKEN